MTFIICTLNKHLVLDLKDIKFDTEDIYAFDVSFFK